MDEDSLVEEWERVRRFAELSERLMSDYDVHATLERICHLAVEIIPGVTQCGITVRQRRGRLSTLAATAPIVNQGDHLQYELREGPCVASALQDEPFMVQSTRSDQRWPRWGPRAADLGLRALISVELSDPTSQTEPGTLGAINMYAEQPDAFTEEDFVLARLFGIHAGNALAAAQRVTTLEDAVDRKHQIGVAQGVLMRRYDLDADQAFSLLQRTSNDSNVKLREVAADVIRRGELPQRHWGVAEESQTS